MFGDFGLSGFNVTVTFAQIGISDLIAELKKIRLQILYFSITKEGSC